MVLFNHFFSYKIALLQLHFKYTNFHLIQLIIFERSKFFYGNTHLAFVCFVIRIPYLKLLVVKGTKLEISAYKKSISLVILDKHVIKFKILFIELY